MAGIERQFVFLSYAREDLDQVRKIYEGLKKRELKVWFDEADYATGKWKPQIMKAISHSRYAVFCLSNAKNGDRRKFKKNTNYLNNFKKNKGIPSLISSIECEIERGISEEC